MESMRRSQLIDNTLAKVHEVTNVRDRPWVMRFLRQASEPATRPQPPRQPACPIPDETDPPSSRPPALPTSVFDGIGPQGNGHEVPRARVRPEVRSVRPQAAAPRAVKQEALTQPARASKPEHARPQSKKKPRSPDEALRQGMAALEAEGSAVDFLRQARPSPAVAQATTGSSKGVRAEPAWPELDAWAQEEEEQDRRPSRIRYGKRRYADEGLVNTMLVPGGLLRALTGAEAVGEKGNSNF